MNEASGAVRLTILMPCLNEESNIAFCIEQAKEYIRSHGLSGEVLIVDNDSTDRSAEIAEELGASVIAEKRRGYGRALRTGLAAAAGEVIVFGDCDTTYDFLHLDPIYDPLASGKVDFMMGDRFGGLMEKNAMSLSHRLGVPFLSLAGRLKFGVKVNDFHSGIRGLTREALKKMKFHTTGMEFATEMIAEASRKGLRIDQTSIPLKCSVDENRQPKLRTIRDGFRHLWYIIRA